MILGEYANRQAMRGAVQGFAGFIRANIASSS